MIQLTDKVLAVWFLCGGAPRDWLACLEKRDDGHVLLTYRIRYYDKEDPGNDPHSGKDKKSWCQNLSREALPAEALEIHMAAIRKVAISMAEAGFQPPGYTLYEVRNNGDFKAFVEEFLKLPFVHKREASPAEAEELKKALAEGGPYVG